MKPPLFVRSLSESEREQLEAGLRSSEAFVLKRCQMLRASAQGKSVPQIHAAFGYPTQTIRGVLHAFNQEGLGALTRKSNRPKTARPVLDETRRERLKALLEQSPRAFGKEASIWTLALVAEVANEQGLTPTVLNHESVRIAIQRLGLNWKRAKAWIASPDPAYERKKSGVTG